MTRQRKLSLERKEFLQKLLSTYQPEEAQDDQNMFKHLRKPYWKQRWMRILGTPITIIKTTIQMTIRMAHSKKPVTSTMGSIPLLFSPGGGIGSSYPPISNIPWK